MNHAASLAGNSTVVSVEPRVGTDYDGSSGLACLPSATSSISYCMRLLPLSIPTQLDLPIVLLESDEAEDVHVPTHASSIVMRLVAHLILVLLANRVYWQWELAQYCCLSMLATMRPAALSVSHRFVSCRKTDACAPCTQGAPLQISALHRLLML